MSLWRWLRTAASNGSADASINWREGMAPSAVNDSARAMMAAIAKYRDDAAGMITTGGTAGAYTVTSYQTFASLQDGIAIAFVPHATNNASATLNVDGLGAKPLRIQTATAIPASVLVAGTPYTAVYNLGADEWRLQGYYSSATTIPLGAILPYTGSTAPNSNFVLCYGQAVSRTTYAALYALVADTYGAGNGTTTFNLPDLRGRVIAGYDSMGGSSANRLTAQTGGVQGDTIGATGGTETHTLTSAQLAAHTHGTGTLATGSDGAHTHFIANGDSTTGTALSASNTLTKDAALGGNDSYILQGTATAATIGLTSSDGAHTHALSGATASAGSGDAHNNVQPTIVLPYIMRVL